MEDETIRTLMIIIACFGLVWGGWTMHVGYIGLNKLYKIYKLKKQQNEQKY